MVVSAVVPEPNVHAKRGANPVIVPVVPVSDRSSHDVQRRLGPELPDVATGSARRQRAIEIDIEQQASCDGGPSC